MADRSARLAFILSLTDKVSAPLGKVKTSFSDLATKGEANIKQMALGLGGMVGAAKGISESLEPALEMNRALGEVRSLGVAEDALTSLNQKALEFSTNYGTNARDFAASAYSISGAIKGLVGEQLATFTNTSNLLAKATKSDADTMGAYVGTMYNLFKTSADAMGKSQWVEKLGGQTALAAQLFRTDGAQLKDAFKEVGQIANTAGTDIAEQFAVIGTLSSTMEGGDAGGLYKSFFENIGAASEKLKLKFTEQNGQLMPMADILAKLEGKFGDLNSAAAGAKLTEAFGGEGARVITALAKDTDRFKNSLDQLGKVRGLENAKQMAEAMVDPWQKFGSAVIALRVSFGQALIPMLSPLMDKLVGIASTLTRWTQIFPNITRVIGATVLIILGLVAAMSAVTLVVGISKMAWLGALTVWKLLNWQGYKSIAMFVFHTVMVAAFVVGLIAMYTWMGVVRVGMMLWQGAIWLVNAALLANPVLLIVAGILALIAVVVAAVVYWDQWTSALMNTAAFQWIQQQLEALSNWFGSIGGWSGMASAAWDGIVSIFRSAISGLIEMINKIPGVQIDASFGELPKAPVIPGIEAPQIMPATQAQNLNTPQIMSAAPGPSMPAPQIMTAPRLPGVAAPLALLPSLNEQAEENRKSVNAGIGGGLSPKRPNAVPPGGLLTSIQNNSNSQNKGNTVENVNIHTSKPMTPLELENMVSMAVGG